LKIIVQLEIARPKRETSSLNGIFNNECFQILDMLLQHLGNERKLPTRNSEEPLFLIGLQLHRLKTMEKTSEQQ
jgi:hypothetical protein